MIHLSLFKGVLFCIFFSASAFALSAPRIQDMDITTWNTYCFGRFLIKIPNQSTVKQSYQLWGDSLVKIQGNPDQILSTATTREQELKTAPRGKEGSLLLRRIDHSPYAISLLSWDKDVPGSSKFQWIDTYIATEKSLHGYRYSGSLAADRQRSAINFSDSLSNKIKYRKDSEIPSQPGFCIDGGYIAGNDFMSEGFRVGVTLPNHPGARISFRSSTGAAPDTLLERAGSFLRTQVLGAATGLDTLRKGKRDIGPIQGEEYLVASNAKGQRVYAFKWESQGKDNSLAEPNLSLELNVLGRDDDTVPPKAFRSDEEALQLWDALLDSIRLRPGAV